MPAALHPPYTAVAYHPPDQAARERIGRDIKGPAKQVAKCCDHRAALPTLGVFARCAMFLALDLPGVKA